MTSGQVNRDPRLQAIDLSALVRTVDLTLVGPDGAPVPKCEIRIYQPGRFTTPIDWRTVSNGRLRVVSRSPFDAWIASPGWQTALVRVIDGDQTIRLERGVGVTAKLRFRQLPALRKGERFRVRLEPVGNLLDIDEWPRRQLDAAGSCEFRLDDAGRYRLRLMRFAPEGGSTDAAIRIDPDGFEIVAEGAAPTIEVEIEVFE